MAITENEPGIKYTLSIRGSVDTFEEVASILAASTHPNNGGGSIFVNESSMDIGYWYISSGTPVFNPGNGYYLNITFLGGQTSRDYAKNQIALI